MGESKHNPNQKRHQRVKPELLTAEQQAELKAAQEKAASEAKAESERLYNWGKSLEKMTNPQFKAEMRRITRSHRVKTGKDTYEPVPDLFAAFAATAEIMVTNTKTRENPSGKLSTYVR